MGTSTPKTSAVTVIRRSATATYGALRVGIAARLDRDRRSSGHKRVHGEIVLLPCAKPLLAGASLSCPSATQSTVAHRRPGALTDLRERTNGNLSGELMPDGHRRTFDRIDLVGLEIAPASQPFDARQNGFPMSRNESGRQFVGKVAIMSRVDVTPGHCNCWLCAFRERRNLFLGSAQGSGAKPTDV
jgi:hypothetical protein